MLKKGFLCVVLLFTMYLQAEVFEAFSLSEIDHVFEQIDRDTLVVLDMDYTLIQPEHPAFHRQNSWRYLDWLVKQQKDLSEEEWSIYPAVCTFEQPSILVESRFQELIRDLQQKKIPLIILTENSIGEIGPYPIIENLRDQRLQDLGIDLCGSMYPFQSFIFDTLKMERGYYPQFHNGVLSTNGSKNKKGEVLLAFLNQLQQKPAHLIFVDDKKYYIDSIEESLKETGIHLTNIHYRAAEIYPTIDLSESAVKQQWLNLSKRTKELHQNKNYVVVHGDRYLLEIYHHDHTLLATFPIGLGKHGIHKTKEGDQKTPSGEYHILWKASVFYDQDGGLPITKELGYCGKNNTYFAQEPDESILHVSLLHDHYGGQKAVFMCLDYPNESDQKKGYSGDGIAIHATELGGIGEPSSYGCIRMHPQDARILYTLVQVGSKVIIQAD